MTINFLDGMIRVVNSYLLVIILMIGKLMIIVNNIYMLHLGGCKLNCVSKE